VDEIGCSCEWERHGQAFRWFPELGPPLRTTCDADEAVGMDHDGGELSSPADR
jgi:hypothetical protein